MNYILFKIWFYHKIWQNERPQKWISGISDIKHCVFHVGIFSLKMIKYYKILNRSCSMMKVLYYICRMCFDLKKTSCHLGKEGKSFFFIFSNSFLKIENYTRIIV